MSALNFIIISSGLSYIQNISGKLTYTSDNYISNVYSGASILPVNVHTYQLYLLKQHSESLKK